MQTIRFSAGIFFCVPQVGCWPSAIERRMVSNLSAVEPSKGSPALVPDCCPPFTRKPIKIRVKPDLTVGTVQSCDEIISSVGDRRLHDANDKTSAGRRMGMGLANFTCALLA